jgi:hypothetical protein
MLFAVIRVEFLSLSPTEVHSGGTITGTVTLVAPPTGAVKVYLSSTNFPLAPVPPYIVVAAPSKAQVNALTRTKTFTIGTTSGGAGCSTISARDENGTRSQSQLLFVLPPSTPVGAPVSLAVSGATGSVLVMSPDGPPGPVQLSSSTPRVTVPFSMTPATHQGIPGAYRGTFEIKAASVSVPGCAIITATFQGSQSRALLKLTPSAPLPAPEPEPPS